MSVQSRIQAFEALSSSSSTAMTTTTTTPTPSTPNNTSSNLLEFPISPTANSFQPIIPLVASASPSRSRSPSPNLARQTSLIDLKDWIVEDGPLERPPAIRHTLTAARTSKLNGIHESSRIPPPSAKLTPTECAPNSSTPLINFDSPPKPRPPLPPRKPSFNTADRVSAQRLGSTGGETGATLRAPGRLDSLVIEHTYPPGPHKFGASRVGHTSASSVSSFHSVSLSSDGSNTENYGPQINTKPPSFSSETDSMVVDFDSASIAESFENVPVPSAASPSTVAPFDWEQVIGKPESSPKFIPPGLSSRHLTKIPVTPSKPLVRSISGSSSSTATSTKTRRPPPPPPPPYQPRSRPSSSRASVVSTSASASDRSSIRSDATTTSRTSISTRNSAQLGSSAKLSSLLRPTPVPPAARSRYESLFDSAVRGQRKAEKKSQKTKLLAPPSLVAKKAKQASGWRGISMDLITNPDDRPVLPFEKGPDESENEEQELFPVAPDERLNGQIVKFIWNTSNLDRKTLRSVWNDCDPQCTGLVNRDMFIRGMWRIDEELRRAQLARRTSALTAASSQRIPHRPLPPARPQDTTRLLV